MKEFMKNKKALVIGAVIVLLIAVIAVVAITKTGKEPNPEPVTTNETQTESTTQAESTTNSETTTEKVTETTKKAKETTTVKVTEKATEKETEAYIPTTTKKTETVTQKKKTETTTKKSTESTTKKKKTTTKSELSEEEMNRQILYMAYGGEAAYKQLIADEAAYKCEYCGKHNCPSLSYHKNELGDIISHSTTLSKCPKASTAKCPYCGCTLVDSTDPRSDKEGYCTGYCTISIH